MPTAQEELMTATLFFNAAFPVMQVVLDDDPKMKEKFRDLNATVQIGAKTYPKKSKDFLGTPEKEDGLIACHLDFNHGKVSVVQGPAEKPELTMTFGSVAKMNAMFRGRRVFARHQGILASGAADEGVFPPDVADADDAKKPSQGTGEKRR